MRFLVFIFLILVPCFIFAENIPSTNDDMEPLFDSEEPPFLVKAFNLNYPAYKPVETKENYRFYFLIGPYLPKKLSSGDYAFTDFFGNKSRVFSNFEFEIQLLDTFGITGLKTGFSIFAARAKGLYSGETTRSSETVTFWVLPIEILGVQTFRFTSNQILVPYIEAGLSYFPFFQTMDAEKTHYGGRTVLVFGGGIKVLLDWIDYHSAWKLDSTHGINNSYLVINYRTLKNLSTKNGMDFSGAALTFGIALDF